MPADRENMLQLDVRATLHDFTLEVQAGIRLQGVTGLFGPSGSGKSTLLRTIAGFERGAVGKVQMLDQTWLDSSTALYVAAHRRPVGYVFQDARLFEHLDVAGNLAFAARHNHGDGPQFDDVIAALDIEPLLQRAVTSLSGGERQRVALARTLLCNPQLLLLDEPLAALDAKRKNDIIPYLESLQSRFALPTLYVSHAIDEIIRLADRVLVLEKGRVRAQGETRQVLNALEPGSDSERFEASSVLEGHVVQLLPDLGLVELRVGAQVIFIPQRGKLAQGDRLLLRVRAGEVAIATSKPRDISIRNVLHGRLQSIDVDPQQTFAMACIDIDGSTLRCQLTRQAVIELGLETGMPVFALLKTASFDPHS